MYFYYIWFFLRFYRGNFNLQIVRNLLVFSQIVLSFLVIWVIYYECNDCMLDGQSLIQFIVSYFKPSEESDRLLLGDLWFSIHQKSLQLIQPMIERYVAVWLWDPVFLFILQLPLAVILFFGLVVVFIINFFFRLFWP